MTQTYDRYSVQSLSHTDGSKWQPVHTSFSKTSCEEEYDKAVKNPKFKSVKLLDPSGNVLRSYTVGEATTHTSEQLSLL